MGDRMGFLGNVTTAIGVGPQQSSGRWGYGGGGVLGHGGEHVIVGGVISNLPIGKGQRAENVKGIIGGVIGEEGLFRRGTGRAHEEREWQHGDNRRTSDDRAYDTEVNGRAYNRVYREQQEDQTDVYARRTKVQAGADAHAGVIRANTEEAIRSGNVADTSGVDSPVAGTTANQWRNSNNPQPQANYQQQGGGSQQSSSRQVPPNAVRGAGGGIWVPDPDSKVGKELAAKQAQSRDSTAPNADEIAALEARIAELKGKKPSAAPSEGHEGKAEAPKVYRPASSTKGGEKLQSSVKHRGDDSPPVYVAKNERSGDAHPPKDKETHAVAAAPKAAETVAVAAAAGAPAPAAPSVAVSAPAEPAPAPVVAASAPPPASPPAGVTPDMAAAATLAASPAVASAPAIASTTVDSATIGQEGFVTNTLGNMGTVLAGLFSKGSGGRNV